MRSSSSRMLTFFFGGSFGGVPPPAGAPAPFSVSSRLPLRSVSAVSHRLALTLHHPVVVFGQNLFDFAEFSGAQRLKLFLIAANLRHDEREIVEYVSLVNLVFLRPFPDVGFESLKIVFLPGRFLRLPPRGSFCRFAGFALARFFREVEKSFCSRAWKGPNTFPS